jgi:hypothetical protein
MQIIILGSAAAILIYSFVVAFMLKRRGGKSFTANLFLPGYTLNQKLTLTGIAIVTFLIFGLATASRLSFRI